MAIVKTNRKGRRVEGAEGSRGEGGEKRRCRRPQGRIEDKYPSALQFGVHLAGLLPCKERALGFSPEDYTWDDAECAIAEEALERGFALAVPVPETYIAQATASITQNLCRNVWVRYDDENHRLILWDREPHEHSKSAGAKEA